MPNKLERIKIYTTATQDLDLEQTLCLHDNVGQSIEGKTVRLVHVLLNEFKLQYNSYVQNHEAALCAFEWQHEQQLGKMLAFDAAAAA
ncbi:MAG: hypothetical protein OEX03_06300 [Gammaproteobacteria bacterium]|nr:hypothetical protein [Gammaproteobacteria bacterium]